MGEGGLPPGTVLARHDLSWDWTRKAPVGVLLVRDEIPSVP